MATDSRSGEVIFDWSHGYAFKPDQCDVAACVTDIAMSHITALRASCFRSSDLDPTLAKQSAFLIPTTIL